MRAIICTEAMQSNNMDSYHVPDVAEDAVGKPKPVLGLVTQQSQVDPDAMTMAEEEVRRIEMRKQKNRISAKASYRRRKKMIAMMQDECMTLKCKNSALKEENAQLRNEMERLQCKLTMINESFKFIRMDSYSSNLHNAIVNEELLFRPNMRRGPILPRDGAFLAAIIDRILPHDTGMASQMLRTTMLPDPAVNSWHDLSQRDTLA